MVFQQACGAMAHVCIDRGDDGKPLQGCWNRDPAKSTEYRRSTNTSYVFEGLIRILVTNREP